MRFKTPFKKKDKGNLVHASSKSVDADWKNGQECDEGSDGIAAGGSLVDLTDFNDLAETEGPGCAYEVICLTRWGQNKMADSLQTTLSNAFSW